MLSGEIIRQVKQIEIRTGRQVSELLAGEYLSVFKGSGMEFEEVRPYVPGDDIRTIDWNVTARMGMPYVKRFVEERELTVLLLVDISPSQNFGTAQRSKREAAVELSALLAFAAIQNQDKIGLLLFDRGAEEYIPPRKGQKHALRVIREVLARSVGHSKSPKPFWKSLGHWLKGAFHSLKVKTHHSPRNQHIAHALEFLQKVLKRRAVIFLISDFIDHGYWKVLQNANRKHDVIAVWIQDQGEYQIPPIGLLTLRDAEQGKVRTYDSSDPNFQSALQENHQKQERDLKHRWAASGIDLISIDATQSVIDPLIQFFKNRQRRIRR